MKQIYICEKCGKQFEEYEDCYHCETTHITSFSSALEPETEKRLKYKPGCAAPTELILPTDHYDLLQDRTVIDPILWRYKLVGPVPEQEAAEIIAERDQRKAEEAQWMADYYARKEREKAEQEKEAEEETA